MFEIQKLIGELIEELGGANNFEKVRIMAARLNESIDNHVGLIKMAMTVVAAPEGQAKQTKILEFLLKAIVLK